MRISKRTTASGVAAMLFAASGAPLAHATNEVNIYSYRQSSLIRPLLKAFEKKTGIKSNVVFAKRGLIARARAEGTNSPVDLILTVDIGRLTTAVKEGVTQSVKSQFLSKQIPVQYRGTDNRWFALTTRLRVIYASRDRVNQNAITLEELATRKWKGRICVRSGQHVYNVAMIASMLAHHGEAKTKTWLTGLRDNLARRPSGNDRSQIKGVYSGECDIAIGNTYYMGKMQTNDKKPEQKKWAASVKMLFPNSEDRGAHVNVSGMVMAKHAPNRNNALKLMEYLASNEAQSIYAKANFEYPVSANVPWSERVKSWGTFKADPVALDKIAKLRQRASELVDEVAFNAGPVN